MLKLAMIEHPKFALDLRETRRDKPSYTVDTLAELRCEHPDAALCFIMGTDSFLSLNRWHRWQKLLQLANLVIIQRPGESSPDTGAMGHYFCKHVKHTDQMASVGGIYRLSTDMLDISSTMIREAISSGNHGWPQLMPAAVTDFIRKNKLYLPIKSE